MGPFSEQVEGGIGPSALPIQFAGAPTRRNELPALRPFLQSMVCTPSLQSAAKAHAVPLPLFCKCAHNGFILLPLLLGQRATGGPASFYSPKGVALSAFRLPCCCACARCTGRGIRYAAHAGTCLGIPCAVERACGRRRFCTLSVQQGRRTDSGRRTLTAQGRCPNARKNQKKSIDSAFYLWLYY